MQPPADVVFSPTLPPDERRAALATRPATEVARAVTVTAAPAAVAIPALPSTGSAGIAVAPAKHVRPHTLINQDGASTEFPAACWCGAIGARRRLLTCCSTPHFQVQSRSGGRGVLYPWERGWKDTVLLQDGETVEVLIRFDGYRGLYLMHATNLNTKTWA